MLDPVFGPALLCTYKKDFNLKLLLLNVEKIKLKKTFKRKRPEIELFALSSINKPC